MERRLVTVLGALLCLAFATASSRGEDASAQGAAATKVARVQVTIERYQGERKIGSAPYTILTTTSGTPVKLRMGVEVPVAYASTGGKDGSTTNLQYKSVGTNFDCEVREQGDRYLVGMDIENSSAYSASGKSPEPARNDAASQAPLFRSFNVKYDVPIQDGQTLQTVASTDPVTGEVVKIELTLKIIK